MSERYNPRTVKKEAKPLARHDSRNIGTPNPPNNPEFESFSDAVQTRIATCFENGLKLRSLNDYLAREAGYAAWDGWVARCAAKRPAIVKPKKRVRASA